MRWRPDRRRAAPPRGLPERRCRRVPPPSASFPYLVLAVRVGSLPGGKPSPVAAKTIEARHKAAGGAGTRYRLASGTAMLDARAAASLRGAPALLRLGVYDAALGVGDRVAGR